MKPHKTIKEQVQLLMDRGLLIDDPVEFGEFLRLHNYYRIRGYFHPFLEEVDGKRLSTFLPGSTGQLIFELVEFDQKLRTLLFTALSNFETQFRASVAYHAGAVDPHVHLEGTATTAEFRFIDSNTGRSKFDEWKETYLKALKSNSHNEIVIRHQVGSNGRLPIWAAVEVLNLGSVSALLRAFEEDLATTISKDFGCSASFFKSAVATLNDLRNHVAHQARIWNFHYPTSPIARVRKIPTDLGHIGQISDYQRRKLFTRLSLLLFFDRNQSLGVGFESSLKSVLGQLPDSPHLSLNSMGWQTEFAESCLWQGFKWDGM